MMGGGRGGGLLGGDGAEGGDEGGGSGGGISGDEAGSKGAGGKGGDGGPAGGRRTPTVAHANASAKEPTVIMLRRLSRTSRTAGGTHSTVQPAAAVSSSRQDPHHTSGGAI